MLEFLGLFQGLRKYSLQIQKSHAIKSYSFLSQFGCDRWRTPKLQLRRYASKCLLIRLLPSPLLLLHVYLCRWISLSAGLYLVALISSHFFV